MYQTGKRIKSTLSLIVPTIDVFSLEEIEKERSLIIFQLLRDKVSEFVSGCCNTPQSIYVGPQTLNIVIKEYGKINPEFCSWSDTPSLIMYGSKIPIKGGCNLRDNEVIVSYWDYGEQSES
jgi:hypothetical protein